MLGVVTHDDAFGPSPAHHRVSHGSHGPWARRCRRVAQAHEQEGNGGTAGFKTGSEYQERARPKLQPHKAILPSGVSDRLLTTALTMPLARLTVIHRACVEGGLHFYLGETRTYTKRDLLAARASAPTACRWSPHGHCHCPSERKERNVYRAHARAEADHLVASAAPRDPSSSSSSSSFFLLRPARWGPMGTPVRQRLS